MSRRTSEAPISFETDIRPLFRPRDQASMRRAFDLWSYADVSAHAETILRAVSSGYMPCDGDWSADKVALLKAWIDTGCCP